MVDIDYILELLDSGNSKEDQQRGIELARDVKCLNAFMQPGPPYDKRVWENCATVLSERSDEELHYHLFSLMEWLQDLNWPGSIRILERLKNYNKDDSRFQTAFNTSMKKATALNHAMWLYGLDELREEPQKG